MHNRLLCSDRFYYVCRANSMADTAYFLLYNPERPVAKVYLRIARVSCLVSQCSSTTVVFTFSLSRTRER